MRSEIIYQLNNDQDYFYYLKENPMTSVLIITHYTRILDYIKPNFVHILKDKKIVKSGDYELAKLIEKNGYNQSFVVSGDDSCE